MGGFGRVVVWVLIAAECVMIGLAGGAKFANPDLWRGLFQGWGYPPDFAYVVGAVEVVGAVLLVVPRTAAWAACILLVVMLSATATVLLHPGDMGPSPSLIHVVVLTVVLAARWPVRFGRPARAGASAS
ncbi:MAG: DoxX family protein [Gemmatimonadota bacterium]|jgi:uncharacterized membrane protein YphA (DoxX/SURF4 family)